MKRYWHQEVADVLKVIIDGDDSLRSVCMRANMSLDGCSKLLKHLERSGLVYCWNERRRYVCRMTERACAWMGALPGVRQAPHLSPRTLST